MGQQRKWDPIECPHNCEEFWCGWCCPCIVAKDIGDKHGMGLVYPVLLLIGWLASFWITGILMGIVMVFFRKDLTELMDIEETEGPCKIFCCGCCCPCCIIAGMKRTTFAHDKDKKANAGQMVGKPVVAVVEMEQQPEKLFPDKETTPRRE